MTFTAQKVAWSRPPVDDVGYLSSEDLLSYSDEDLRQLVENMEQTRYTGWRSYDGQWRKLFHLDEPGDALVLDYGCGVGIEALQYAKMGYRVILADIVAANIKLASRILGLYGYEPEARLQLRKTPPDELYSEPIDIIHCVGVLHHIPNALEVLRAMHGWLADDGELRLMLYSNWAWYDVTGSEAPEDPENHPDFEKFVRGMDGVGDYADWYSLEKLDARYGDLFKMKRWADLTSNLHYLGVVLEKA
jgi:SAM-dependent methyltransferase